MDILVTGMGWHGNNLEGRSLEEDTIVFFLIFWRFGVLYFFL
jgi:hypothetical protein